MDLVAMKCLQCIFRAAVLTLFGGRSVNCLVHVSQVKLLALSRR